MRRMQCVRIVVGLSLLLPGLLGGCTQYRDPSVNVHSVSASSMTQEAMVLDFMLELSNPNQESLRLHEFHYDVAVDGVKVYSGVRAAEATLASLDQRHVRVPAVIRFDAVGWSLLSTPAAAQYAITGTLRYIAPGELARMARDLGLPKPRASFSGTGEVALAVAEPGRN